MRSSNPHALTELLVDLRHGKREALDELYTLVEDELRSRAHQYLSRERADHTMSTTALVHETYLKLADLSRLDWQDRSHFYAVAATAMRRILVSYARMHKSEKRWGAKVRVSLDESAVLSEDHSEDLLAIDDALEGLNSLNPRLSQVVELRFFGGLTIDETAQVLDLAPSTVKLDWQKARAWLYRELQA